MFAEEIEPSDDEADVERSAEKTQDDEDDENETCGFCKYMKGGPCREPFTVRLC